MSQNLRPAYYTNGGTRHIRLAPLFCSTNDNGLSQTLIVVWIGLSCAENLPSQLEAGLFETLTELRAEAGRLQYAATQMARPLSAMVRCLVDEDVLNRDLRSFHALHFAHLNHLAATILEAAL